MARFTTKINSRGAIRGRTCARCATACPRNRRWFIARRTRYARARAFPRRSRLDGAARPRSRDSTTTGKQKTTRVHRRFARQSSGSSVVVCDAARPSIPERRTTRSFAKRAPCVSRPETSALTAPLSPPRHPRARPPFGVASPGLHDTHIARAFSKNVFQKKNTRRTCACRATATCTPRTASRARTSARP